MCVAAIAWKTHDRWPLVVIGNRDEYHARAAKPLSRWECDHPIIAGRDLVGGGTWLGVSETGRFALVTNRRGFGAPDPSCKSRGEMVRSVLADPSGPALLAEEDLSQFNPFSLFTVMEAKELSFHTNRPYGLHAPLPPGIFGLSNGSLDEPWPKTLSLKAAVGEWLAGSQGNRAPLFAALRSEALPDAGIPPLNRSDIAVEPQDTPPFIRNDLYGTRCSTVITVNANGHGIIEERSFAPDGRETGRVEVMFRWPPFR